MEALTKIEPIASQTLIISCEACGEVRYLDAGSDEEVSQLFADFHCKKNCDRSYYSYITIGQISLPRAASAPPAALAPDKRAATS